MDAIKMWLLSKVKDYLLKNWKTTLAGILGAAATQIPALKPFQEPILALAVAIVALLAKDGDQTGTTTQPRELPQPAVFEVQPLDSSLRPPG